MRTCVVTRDKLPKKELIRFVLDSETNKVVIDQNGKSVRGRGANMSPSLEVYDEGLNRRSLPRALNTHIKEEDLDTLRAELEEILKAREIKNREKKTVRVSSKDFKKVQNGKKEK